MPSEIISIGNHFGATLGLAAFVGIPGRGDEHSHWTHQIAIDMDGGSISCFCDGQMFEGQGVFVPAGHAHAVKPGRQINLFFDESVNWIDEIFGGTLDTSCARVLDRDTLQGIQSCFYHSGDLVSGMSIFASAFDLRMHASLDPMAHRDWDKVLEKVRNLINQPSLPETELHQKLGALFAR